MGGWDDRDGKGGREMEERREGEKRKREQKAGKP
jgi:hypothetical protein